MVLFKQNPLFTSFDVFGALEPLQHGAGRKRVSTMQAFLGLGCLCASDGRVLVDPLLLEGHQEEMKSEFEHKWEKAGLISTPRRMRVPSAEGPSASSVLTQNLLWGLRADTSL